MVSHLILVTILQISYIGLCNINPQRVSGVCLLCCRGPGRPGAIVIPPGTQSGGKET